MVGWVLFSSQSGIIFSRKRSDRISFEGYFLPLCMQTYLGGGNSNIFYFHPEIWGCMIPKFDYIMFFKWVGSTTNQITATSQPQPIRVFQKKKWPYLRPEAPFPKPIILGIHVSFRVCVWDWKGLLTTCARSHRSSYTCWSSFWPLICPLGGPKGLCPHDAGSCSYGILRHFQRDFWVEGVINFEVSFNRDT